MIQSKTPKCNHPNKKHTAKTHSTNITDVNFSRIFYGNSYCVEFLK